MLQRVPPARRQTGQGSVSTASFRSINESFDTDKDDHGLTTFQQRLQQHVLLLPFRAERTPAMQVLSSSHVFQNTACWSTQCPTQKRFDTALECLLGLGVPLAAGPPHVASHVLCCGDEWQKRDDALCSQQSPIVIDAIQFSLGPPHLLYHMLLP